MPKSYSQYKNSDIIELDLTLIARAINVSFVEVKPSDFLEKNLERNKKMTLNTEKAKSEFIIAPILYEIVLRNEDKISFFSGHNLDVDSNLGLKGFCDFIFSGVPERTYVQTPIICVAEAKNDNLEKGVPQCVAEMYASRILNEREKKNIKTIYGCVTTGYQWQFLKLEGNLAIQDTTIYSLVELPKILGILESMIFDALSGLNEK
jgi:hypothetical protein